MPCMPLNRGSRKNRQGRGIMFVRKNKGNVKKPVKIYKLEVDIFLEIKYSIR